MGKNDGRRRRIGSLQETPIDQLQYRGYDKLSRWYCYITDAHNIQICPLMKKSWQDPFLLFEYFRFLIKVDKSIFFPGLASFLHHIHERYCARRQKLSSIKLVYFCSYHPKWPTLPSKYRLHKYLVKFSMIKFVNDMTGQISV